MEASATLPQAIDSLQSSTNCHLSFDCGPGQMISQDDRERKLRLELFDHEVFPTDFYTSTIMYLQGNEAFTLADLFIF
jgi:hypothetical protein